MKLSVRQRILQTLSDGRKHHAAELTLTCHTSDPRGIIRDLRRAGHNILDEWATSPTGARYKLFWLAKQNEQDDGTR